MIVNSLTDQSVIDMFFRKDVVFDFEKDKESFIEHMDTLKVQDVQEATLYKKWVELKQFDNTKDVVATGLVKSMLWAPTDIFDKEKTIEELNNLKPQIIICEEGTQFYDMWKYLRLLIHTMEFSIGIGRLIKILVFDVNTNKVIGLASIASDVISIGVRDKWIGWSKEDKFEKGKLNQTCIASTIVATQPFGYNFLGGKLIASLLCTKDVRDAWEKKFNQKLVGMTTTSLYGGHSMYQRIPFWKKLGKTTGKILLKPDDEHFKKWSGWLKENHIQEYEHASCGKAGIISHENDKWIWTFKDTVREHATTRDELIDQLAEQKFSVHDNNVVHDLRGKLVHPPSGPKQNVINKIYSHLSMKSSQYIHGFKRGVYFASFYENTKEFLRSEIEEDELIGSKKLENDVDDVMDWWRPKAIRRYTNLLEQDRIKPEHLFYREMIKMRTWEEVKQTYLFEVGR